MFGGGSIQLARVFGIRIAVDFSWFLILFLIIFSLSGYYGDQFPGEGTKSFLLAVVSALLFFTSVALHELGHAVVARRNGIDIGGITLWMFGGVAWLKRDPDSPGAAFRVAVAGPLVTLAIIGACFGLGALHSGAAEVGRAVRFSTGSFDAAVAVLGYLAFVNGALLAFNLIPGYPLDGGQMLRAIVWWRTGNRNRATSIAARIGRGCAVVMVGFGLYLLLFRGDLGGIWLAVIGMFLGGAARQTQQQSELASQIEGLRVADVMDAEPVAVPEGLSLERAYDEFFLRYRWPWFPVVDGSGRLVGLVSREAVDGLPEAVRHGRTVGSVMASDAAGSGFRVGLEEPLEALLTLEGLQRLGAIMAVDRDGVLRGIVTLDRVQRALRPAAP